MNFPLLGMPQGAEWLIILAIVILVFGAAKLPALARSSGQALRIFKSETKGLREDDDNAEDDVKAEQIPAELESKQAELDAKQAELDAERQKLNGNA